MHYLHFLISLTMALSTVYSAYAEILSPEQALERFYSPANSVSRKISATPKTMQLRHTFTGETGNIAYLFSKPQQEGFVVLSADSRTASLLGYSHSAADDNMPPQLIWLIDEYGRQLEYMRTHNIQANETANDAWPAIEPLVKSTWDQGAPYFDMTPEDKGKHCYTGCVATAMAQVMKYWNYPECGTGTHKYTTTTLKKQLEINFAERPFDWNNMLDSYTEGKYNAQQAEAVAWLMKACGHSVDMNYTTVSSGAQTALIAGALTKYFGYDSSVKFLQRLAYSPSEWRKMVYENIRDIGPVIYNGQTLLSGGHSFICDGYDGNGYFHFNWGWSGMSDGYFLLDVLNPDSQGIGGADGGFNFKQDAIFGIRPSTGESPARQEPQLTQYGSLFAFITGVRTLNFGVENYSPLGWGSINPEIVRMLIGIRIEPTGDTAGEPIVVECEESAILTPGSFYPYGESFTPKARVPVSLPQGTYKVSLVTQDNNSPDGKWMPMIAPYGYADYATLVKNDEGLSVINASTPKFEIPEASVSGEIVFGKPVKVMATIVNNSDFELTQGVNVVLLTESKGFRRFVGEGASVTLSPGQSVQKEIVTYLTPMAGPYDPATDVDFILSLHNPITGEYYGDYGQVKMLESSGIDQIADSDVVITTDKSEIHVSGLGESDSVSLYSIDGKTVGTNSGEDSAHFSGCNPGVYILRIAAKDGKGRSIKIIL